MATDITYIGMDLGSFKTSVASSHGQREVLPSAVAWPRDHVARAMFGRDVVFGEDVFQQRMALKIVRPFEKGALKYLDREQVGMSESEAVRHMEAAKLLVEHIVSLCKPNGAETVFGVIGAPSRASIECKHVLLDATRGVFDAALVVPEPFAVAYGMDRLTSALVVDIGAGTTDICPMYGALPPEEDQVTLPLGGDLIDERICRAIRQVHPEAAISQHLARQLKERYGSAESKGERVQATIAVAGRPRSLDLTDILNESCQALVPAIVEGIWQVVSRLDSEFQRPMLDNIILAGGGSQLRELDRAIERGLSDLGGARVQRVYDSVFAGATGALKLAMRMPIAEWERIRDADRELVAA